MKKIILFIIFGLFISVLDSYAQEPEYIQVHLYGRAGATFNPSGDIKLCPGFRFNICATIEGKLKDIWNLLFNSGPNFPVVVITYDELGQICETSIMNGDIISPHRFDSESSIMEITGDDIILK
ncbi:MAG: hypothetical protein LBP67_10950 [Bacteroidales bacterium]|jgi:hypothetical protein|nr:hypothetical protein [Bacteroidales bacterium]